MYSYEIWVRSQNYHSKKPLTYTYSQKLLPGAIVKVDLRHKPVLGIVRRQAPAPRGVAMKPIDQVLFSDSYTLPSESLQLINWLLAYYPAASGAIAQLFLPPTLGPVTNNSLPADSVVKSIPESTQQQIPKLTHDQAQILKKIFNSHGSFLLHGDTGSGKTRIYIEVALKTLGANKSALVLVPEIGLAPHIEAQFKKFFNPQIIKVFHSGLTITQRRKTWIDILTSDQPMIVIGARSALFTPLKNIGLVVVDECHDDGYKQESAPYYHGLRVASRLAQLHNAKLIFGSATPSIADVYIAEQKSIPILRMTKIAQQKNLTPRQTIVINKRDKSEFTRSSILSTTLVNHIQQQLHNKQQTLLFLNRRGSAKVIACSDCGWQALCPNCELPLTFHEDTFTVRCHTCGHQSKPPVNCPDCGNNDIVFYGPGTKAVEKEVNRLFANARIARFDGDNRVHERLDKRLDAVHNLEIDIIIGTQILVKGFDIPNLGLVGIIDADASLSFPDFSTEEKTYQIISQAIGRVGRGHLPSTVILQSLNPQNPLLIQALSKNWTDFYKNQLSLRQKYNFPPFTFMLKLSCSRKRQASAIEAAQKLKSLIDKQYPSVSVLGPAPAFREKVGGSYSWQLSIKSNRRAILLEIIDNLPSGWSYDIDPIHLL